MTATSATDLSVGDLRHLISDFERAKSVRVAERQQPVATRLPAEVIMAVGNENRLLRAALGQVGLT
ncbi:MAG: hypothetical protein J2P57_11500 [Acidimicrobiaceae bacterium]|nr:hypothetical protein [Acidimicrobiaceae bacterium]